MIKKKKNTIIRAKKIRILVVDDHPIVCDGLAGLINNEADMVVCAKAGTSAEAVKAVKKQRFDLALVDMLLKKTTGVEVTKKIKALCPSLVVMIFSMSDDSRYVQQAFDAGAIGYILKDEVSEKVVYAIRQALKGKVYLSKKLAKKFTKLELLRLVA